MDIKIKFKDTKLIRYKIIKIKYKTRLKLILIAYNKVLEQYCII